MGREMGVITRRRRIMAVWLTIVAGLVFLMIILGGATRLTNSGLSIVEWRPITGWFPPLTTEAWQEAFDAYRQYPEYQLLNRGMSLDAFKEIYWLEYLHRLLGRLIGVSFFVPFAVFVAKGWVDWRLGGILAVLLFLGGLQGALGWFMVQSGLVDQPDVSQYRLVAHLVMAITIYGALLWVAWSLWRSPPWISAGLISKDRWPVRGVIVVCALILMTIVSGGFVAGTNAGFTYNTFPLMDGRLIPTGLLPLVPAYLSFFEDVTTIQFTHRVLATVTVTAALVFVLLAWRQVSPGRGQQALLWLGVASLAQYGLGVATLLLVVPVAMGVAHQGGAVVLWTAALWVLFVLKQTQVGPRAVAHGEATAVSEAEAWVKGAS